MAAAIVLAGGNVGHHLYAAAIAGGGAGTLIGSIRATLIGKHHADFIAHQLQVGGLVLFVTVKDEDQLVNVMNILSRHQASNIHVNELAL